GRAPGRVAARDRGRVEVGADHALGRARLLDLSDDRRAARRDRGLQRGGEAAHRRRIRDPRLELAQRQPPTALGDFLALAVEDPLQDGHGVPASERVASTNCASFARAAPEAMASRALPMPPAIEPATPATYSAAPALSATISSCSEGTLSSACSSIAFDSAASATRRLRVCAMAMPKSSGCTSYSRTSPSRSSPIMVAAPSDS